MPIGFENVRHDEISPGFRGRFDGFKGVSRVVADGDSGLAEEHLRPNSFVGEDLLVGEADARPGQVGLVRRAG